MGLFSFFKRSSQDNKDEKYLDQQLPNGNTIRQQQEIAYKHARGEFEPETPVYLGMHITANTVPAIEGYARLNEDEKTFLAEFQKLLLENKYDPKKIKLTRLGDGTFNVDYTSLCYVGKFCLYKTPAKYSVKKPQNKRATKVFNSIEEASEFAKTNAEYEIIKTEPTQRRYMQYSIGMKSHDLFDTTLDEMISTLPRWIKYLNYCKRN